MPQKQGEEWNFLKQKNEDIFPQYYVLRSQICFPLLFQYRVILNNVEPSL